MRRVFAQDARTLRQVQIITAIRRRTAGHLGAFEQLERLAAKKLSR